MMNNKVREAQGSFFCPQEESIDIHGTVDGAYSRSTLKKIRVTCWVLHSLVYIWQLASASSIFIEVEFLTMNAYFFTYMFYFLVAVDALLDSPDRNIRFRAGFNKWVEAFYELSVVVQVPVTLVYWLLLHSFVLRDFGFWLIILFDLIHSLPIISLLLELKLNTFRFTAKRVILGLLHAAIYLIFNMAYSLLHRPIYPIITWRDLPSFINITMSLIIAIGSFFLFRRIKVSQRLALSIKAKEKQKEQ